MKQLLAGLFLLTTTALNAQMPVKLTKFVVQKTTSGINAVWTTVTESNNAYFELQGSNDGINFVTLGKVNAYGNGDSSMPHDYSLAVTFEKQAGFGLVFGIILIGMALAFVRRGYGIVALLFIVGGVAACSKNNDKAATASTKYSIYRLAQTDKDGTTTYYGQTN